MAKEDLLTLEGQIDEILREVEGVSSEFQVMIDHIEGHDVMTLFFETAADSHREGLEAAVRQRCKQRIGLTIVPKAVAIGDLPRSEKKTNRVFDNRY